MEESVTVANRRNFFVGRRSSLHLASQDSMSPLFVIFERFSRIMARPVKSHERLPPMSNGNEKAAKPDASRLVQQMPNRAYRQRGHHARRCHHLRRNRSLRQVGGSGRGRIQPCPLRHTEATGALIQMSCEHGQRDVCCRSWAYSRHPFCQDKNAGKNERSALLEASRFRKPRRARKASLNVTN